MILLSLVLYFQAISFLPSFYILSWEQLPYQSAVAIFERERTRINYLPFFFSGHRRYANRVLGSSSLWMCLGHLEAVFIKDLWEHISTPLNIKIPVVILLPLPNFFFFFEEVIFFNPDFTNSSCKMGPTASSGVITAFHCLLDACENVIEITQKLLQN